MREGPCWGFGNDPRCVGPQAAPARSVLPAALGALFAVLAATEGWATTMVDLTPGPGSSGTINGVLFEFSDEQPAGTGVLDPFLRLQAMNQEQGYNTSNRKPAFDEIPPPGGFTRDLLFGELVEANGSFHFVLDINESASTANSLLSLDALQIYISTQGSQNTPDLPSLGTLIYDLDAGQDGTVLMDYRNAEGSGVSDMLMSVPASVFAGVQDQDFVILYSRFGDTESSDAGFEEWAALLPGFVVPEPGALPLLGLVALVLAVRRRPGPRRRG